MRRDDMGVLETYVVYKNPAKRSQHDNTTYRNIVGRNMLRAFGHRVATCCDMLGVVGSSLKVFKLEPNTSFDRGLKLLSTFFYLEKNTDKTKL